MFPFEQELPSLISYVHKTSGKVILSSHDFQKTPTCGELLKRLEKMEELGADISKIAVMPQSRKDVLTLLSVTEERSRHALRPVITMSMSETGLISRLAGEVFGSAVTFGSVTNASAPARFLWSSFLRYWIFSMEEKKSKEKRRIFCQSAEYAPPSFYILLLKYSCVTLNCLFKISFHILE